MGKTENGIRYFKCKRCGVDATENVYKWRKKPAHLKNVCFGCIDKRNLAAETARERAQDAGYSLLLDLRHFM